MHKYSVLCITDSEDTIHETTALVTNKADCCNELQQLMKEYAFEINAENYAEFKSELKRTEGFSWKTIDLNFCPFCGATLD